MSAIRISRFLGSATLAASGLGAAVLSVPALPSASAQPCPDVEVAFARGTGEPPGVGPTGQAFVDSLRARTGGKSLDVYPINYPASNEWSTGLDGINDAGAHVVSEAASCPQTKMVLGGYSQGAAVMGFITSASVPDGVDPATVPKPMDPEVANHVSSVVLFGMPNVRAMEFLNQPQVAIGPLYQGKTIKVCATEDPVCSDGMNFAAHDTYADDGAMIDKGAAFAAGHLAEGPAGPPGAGPGAPRPVVGSPGGGFGS
jgi:cutinase